MTMDYKNQSRKSKNNKTGIRNPKSENVSKS